MDSITPPDTTPQTAPVLVTPKPVRHSLTVFFNGAVTILGIFLTLEAANGPQINAALKAAFPDPATGEAVVGVFTALIGLANVVIRVYRTDSPIAR